MFQDNMMNTFTGINAFCAWALRRLTTLTFDLNIILQITPATNNQGFV